MSFRRLRALDQNVIREIRVELLGKWLIECETLNIADLKEPYRTFAVSWCMQDFTFKKVIEFYLKRGRLPQSIGFAHVSNRVRSAY